MRLIDADALLKGIEELKQSPWYENFSGRFFRKEAVEIIEDLCIKKEPTIDAEPMWIPCSERLPENDGGMYLVTDYCEQINRRRIHISYCYVNKEGFWSDIPVGYKVIAWMPLPEPYKEEDNEIDRCR